MFATAGSDHASSACEIGSFAKCFGQRSQPIWISKTQAID